MHPSRRQDRNFDDLAHKFKGRIYGSLKGELRLKTLDRDLAPILAGRVSGDRLNILDGGGGTGRYSISLATQGHRVTLCDISGEMLSLAARELERVKPAGDVTLVQQSIQQVAVESGEKFDLILLHAVLEWMPLAKDALEAVLQRLVPGGYVSVLFYNRDGLAMHKLCNGRLDSVRKGYLTGWKKSLTPTHPLQTPSVSEWFDGWGYQQHAHSGIRCFVDFIQKDKRDQVSDQDMIETELALSQSDPYRGIARYVHLLYQKPEVISERDIK